MTRTALLTSLLLFAAPGWAQTPAPADPPPAGEALPSAPPVPAPPPVPTPPPRLLPKVVITTSLGAITVELDKDKAPLTVANFLKYVDSKRFDGAIFYRALTFPSPTPLGLIQGGIRGRSDKVLPPVKHEPTSQTGLTHNDGAISMARGAPGTANGDFFIILGTLTGLDASEKDPGYAVFGHVVAGMDVVRAIQAAPVSATAGTGAMNGQMLEKPVALISARRLTAAGAAAAAPASARPRR
jgi:peptidyl-prolyl cis-trans isomerase A (cyclophilin A)